MSLRCVRRRAIDAVQVSRSERVLARVSGREMLRGLPGRELAVWEDMGLEGMESRVARLGPRLAGVDGSDGSEGSWYWVVAR